MLGPDGSNIAALGSLTIAHRTESGAANSGCGSRDMWQHVVVLKRSRLERSIALLRAVLVRGMSSE